MSIFNLSSYQLSELERVLLGLGLKFIPSPPTKLADRHNSLHNSIAKFERTLKLLFFFKSAPNFDHTIPYNSHTPLWQIPSGSLDVTTAIYIHDYIQTARSVAYKHLYSCQPTFSDVDALIYSTLYNLLTNPAIVIKPADKNLGLCVMDSKDYREMCLKHVTDASTYTHIVSFDPAPCYAALKDILSKHSLLYSSKKRNRSTEQFMLTPLHHPYCNLRTTADCV